ncbi:MAG: 2-oxoglutarate dehydrogenase complex dihydrolipoyllysine-residue succinyltransferase [Alphaproteobacteria bacterium]|nr:2-oxoglutarate dehydrogenase complex dihydrolipoyllysine-residue succinyltransferase [Alphaproteobacteria bacterium]
MAEDIVVPTLGESVTEATVNKWLKSVGEAVSADEAMVELETDKVNVEVNAPADGVITTILAEEGADVEVGAVLGRFDVGAAGKAARSLEKFAVKEPTSQPATPSVAQSPAVRKLVDENALDAASIPTTGAKGNLTKGDVLKHLEGRSRTATASLAMAPSSAVAPLAERTIDPREEVVKMSRLRQKVAERLKLAQNTAAVLTTFNEVEMDALMNLRRDYKDKFEKKHKVKLGFMSFFVKACVLALKELPVVNAEVHGTNIIYKNYYDIGIAVGSPSGLVVPIIRDADQSSFADIEQSIADFGERARSGKLEISEMIGGSFTITNGGVFGSLLSTPIINPPQTGILGMHKIQKRPVVRGDKIEIANMMYVALSYDHRIIDGREAVTFLVRAKEMLEDPARLLIDI